MVQTSRGKVFHFGYTKVLAHRLEHLCDDVRVSHGVSGVLVHAGIERSEIDVFYSHSVFDFVVMWRSIGASSEDGVAPDALASPTLGHSLRRPRWS
jgi:hypothetical protein